MFLGRVGVYLISSEARLEVDRVPHAVSAPVEGTVAETFMEISLPVKAGDVLVRLDQKDLRLSLDERATQRNGKIAKLKAVRDEVDAERRSVNLQQLAREAALGEARAQASDAIARAEYADQHLAVCQRLTMSRAISTDETNQARADALSARAKVELVRQSLTRLENDRRYQEGQQDVRLAHLQRELVDLEEEIHVDEAAIRHLEYQIELRIIRAPVDGKIGEVAAAFQRGATVRPADRLGAVVPEGTSRVVAYFPATDAGRIRSGQNARLRLDGFAWSEYGTLPATVAHVATESLDGKFRVELALGADPGSLLPREHGPSGRVEVEVEQVSPAALLLRAAGQLLSPRSSPPLPSERVTPR
jgi:membrane fusion protein (multidrug efflux system)